MFIFSEEVQQLILEYYDYLSKSILKKYDTLTVYFLANLLVATYNFIKNDFFACNLKIFFLNWE